MVRRGSHGDQETITLGAVQSGMSEKYRRVVDEIPKKSEVVCKTTTRIIKWCEPFHLNATRIGYLPISDIMSGCKLVIRM